MRLCHTRGENRGSQDSGVSVKVHAKDPATQDSSAYFLKVLRMQVTGLLGKRLLKVLGLCWPSKIHPLLHVRVQLLLPPSTITSTHNFLNHKVKESPGSFLLLSTHGNRDILRFDAGFFVRVP